MCRFLAHFGLLLLIVYLVLFGLPLGPDPQIKLIHQVGITLLLGAWLVSLWRSGRDFPRTPLDGPLAALGVAWAIAAVTSRDPRSSLEAFWLIFSQILLFYFFADLMRRGRQRWLIEGLFLAIVFNVILSSVNLLTWYTSLPKSGLEGWPQIFGYAIPRHVPPLYLNNPNLEAATFVLLIPVTWAWANTMSQRDLRWALKGITITLVAALGLTQSRGGFIGLAAIGGLELTRWLLQAETRERFPQSMRQLLAPRVLILGTIAAGCLGVLLVLGLFTGESDIARLDLWYSAIEILRHHLVVGVGPGQYPMARHAYSIWDRSIRMDLAYAHNLVLQLLAEGGVIVFASAVWLTGHLGKTWWQQYRQAERIRKRRLEGILIALIAFGIHSMVDTFPQMQFIVLLSVMAAYTVVSGWQPQQSRRVARRSAAAPFLLSLLLVAQVAYIPIHRGGLAQRQAVLALDAGEPHKALEAVQDAQAADPWFDLYQIEKAYILGLLAYQNPDMYLTNGAS